MFVRACIKEKGLERLMRNGDGILANPRITSYATDAAKTVTVTEIAGGVLQVTGLTAGRNLTADTAANYLAAFPQLDIGESIECVVGVSVAFALTLVTAAGVTLKGRATVPANTTCRIFITKTSATTVELTVV